VTTTRVLSNLSVAVASALLVAACSGTISTGDRDDSADAGGAGGSNAGRGGSTIAGQGGASGAGGAGGRAGAGGTTANGGSSGNGGSAGRGGSSGSGAGRGGSGGSGGAGNAGSSGSSAGRAGSGGAGGSGNAGSGGTSSGEPAALAGILDAHNAVRAAKGIAPLTWDPALAAIAQNWVEQCVDMDGVQGLVDHNAGRSTGYPTYVGENIFGSSGTASGTGAVSSWAGEEANYDYASNSCASGKVCGHYTQIVWANTTKLGCAIHRCEGLRYASSVVCNYAPGGNVRGQKPY
jgi:pathogenesis-related protein 1